MADQRERVEAELENIQRVLAELPESERCGELSVLELAGVAALLQSFYTGIENVLKQVVAARGEPPPAGPSWHRDLVKAARAAEVLTDDLTEDLARYLAFRHFVGHGYAVNILPERIRPLVRDARAFFNRFQEAIKQSTE